MLGWLRPDADRASRSKRSNRSLFAENFAGKSFIATARSKRVSLARYTSPIPPSPKNETISKGPSLLPGARLVIASDYTLAHPFFSTATYRTCVQQTDGRFGANLHEDSAPLEVFVDVPARADVHDPQRLTNYLKNQPIGSHTSCAFVISLEWFR